MTLSGKEIEKMYEYVQKNGLYKMYSVGECIPCKNGGIGYNRWISTKGEAKSDVADINRF